MVLPYHQAHDLRERWGWLLALGVLLILLGTLAISASVLTTLVTVGFLGILLLLGGLVMIIHAFEARRWGSFLSNLLLGLLYVGLGFLLFLNPAIGAVTLTLLMAAFFIVAGLIRAVSAAAKRFDHWPWFFFSGLVALLLGILIWAQWPVSGLYVIGIFVGIDLLLIGWASVVLAVRARTA